VYIYIRNFGKCLCNKLNDEYQWRTYELQDTVDEKSGRGTAIVKVFKNVSHNGLNCEPFSGKKRTRLQDFAYTISKTLRGR